MVIIPVCHSMHFRFYTVENPGQDKVIIMIHDSLRGEQRDFGQVRDSRTMINS